MGQVWPPGVTEPSELHHFGGIIWTVLIAYVDESNRGDWVSFGAVVAQPEDVQSLTAELNDVAESAYWAHDMSSRPELHGYEIFHGTGLWKDVSPRARIRTYRAALEAIVRHDVTIIVRWCEKSRLVAHQQRKAYPERWPAEQTVFQFLLQRINTLARREDDLAMVIVDIRDDREAHRERFAEYQKSGTPGTYMSTRLPYILDTVHFAPSHHSRMIQAADMVTFMHRRTRTIKESDPRQEKVMAGFRDLLDSSDKMYGCGSWP